MTFIFIYCNYLMVLYIFKYIQFRLKYKNIVSCSNTLYFIFLLIVAHSKLNI